MLAKGENPISRIAHYNRNRGMSWYRDRVDWLGGYPYESATPEEIVDFVEHRGGHLQKTVGTEPSFGLLGSGCAEYVFRF
jgi:2-polyprenyl-6-hydroxyphenyl methylase/3-demethylubiquinone-9 3-methyltransferase